MDWASILSGLNVNNNLGFSSPGFGGTDFAGGNYQVDLNQMMGNNAVDIINPEAAVTYIPGTFNPNGEGMTGNEALSFMDDGTMPNLLGKTLSTDEIMPGGFGGDNGQQMMPSAGTRGAGQVPPWVWLQMAQMQQYR